MKRSLICLAALMLCTGVATAQSYVLNAGNAAGLPGSSVTVSVTLDGTSDMQGFQFGLVHDGAVLTAALAGEGATLAAANNGTGADYFFSDTMPTSGGPGVVLGAVVSLMAPIQSIPAGVDREIGVITYDVSAAATPGTSSALSFSGGLNVPPVAIVVTVDGVSFVPATNAGSVAIETPAVSGLTCATTDTCLCSGQLNWTNGHSYDSIEVSQNGAVIATLPGTATSHDLALGANAQYCVTGIVGTTASAPTCCNAECTVPALGQAPSNLVCSTDHATCEASLSWTNGELDYTSLELHIDGMLAQNLPGSATSATATLVLGTPTTLAVIAFDACGNALAELSCTQECLPEQFIRGDVNNDGMTDISDPIGLLAYSFGGMPLSCLDAADVNDDGGIDISDAVYQLAAIFSMGTPPPAPTGSCGSDPTDTDPLDCQLYNCL